MIKSRDALLEVKCKELGSIHELGHITNGCNWSRTCFWSEICITNGCASHLLFFAVVKIKELKQWFESLFAPICSK